MTFAHSPIYRTCFYSLVFVFFIIASTLHHSNSVLNSALNASLYGPLITNPVIWNQSLTSHVSLPRPREQNLPKIPLVLTLHYKTWYDMPLVLHNCIQAKSVGVQMVVYTEDLASKYCSSCTCILFEPVNCKPPDARPNSRNHCEKLSFMARMIPKYREFIYLDADLLVMHPEKLFRGLASRALTTDFLATYAEGASKEPAKYKNYFNSGMMFIRYIPELNYSELLPRMYEAKSGFDQSILSGFIHDYYTNWDTLSWKWHCRAIIRFKNDVPPSQCLTIHDRGEDHVLLKYLNKSMLTQ